MTKPLVLKIDEDQHTKLKVFAASKKTTMAKVVGLVLDVLLDGDPEVITEAIANAKIAARETGTTPAQALLGALEAYNTELANQ